MNNYDFFFVILILDVENFSTPNSFMTKYFLYSFVTKSFLFCDGKIKACFFRKRYYFTKWVTNILRLILNNFLQSHNEMPWKELTFDYLLEISLITLLIMGMFGSKERGKKREWKMMKEGKKGEEKKLY